MSFVTRALGFLFVLAILAVPATAHTAVHTVSPGDNLYAIGQKFGVDYAWIMSANGLNGTTIYPGMTLYIPGLSGEAPAILQPAAQQARPARSDETARSEATSSFVYTIQKGDNLYSIGQKFGIDYGRIMSANGLNSTTIYPGAILFIPGLSGEAPAVLQPAATNPAPQVSRGYFQRPSPGDVDLLARLITAEADAEPYEGKVAVGAVVLNRLADQDFPKTMQAVIYQNNGYEYQFKPVQNGLIYWPASDESVLAAKEALGGADPTGGALYFFANYSKSTWLWSRPVSKVIGNTIFAY